MTSLLISIPRPPLAIPIRIGLPAFPQPSSEVPDLVTAKKLREAHRFVSASISKAECMDSMKRCPKFSTCSAPICPLDPKWSHRDMLNGEAACTWILEMAKGGTGTRYVPDDIRSDIAQALPSIVPALGMAPLRISIKAAQKTGSRRAPSRFAHLHPQAETTQ